MKGAARRLVGESRLCGGAAHSAGRSVCWSVGPDQVAGGLGAVVVAGTGGGGVVSMDGGVAGFGDTGVGATGAVTSDGIVVVPMLGDIVVPPHCFEGTVIDWLVP